jgi:hypothetical protein
LPDGQGWTDFLQARFHVYIEYREGPGGCSSQFTALSCRSSDLCGLGVSSKLEADQPERWKLNAIFPYAVEHRGRYVSAIPF